MSVFSSSELLQDLADFVSDLISQTDYPGFEARAFRVGLPDKFTHASSRLFAEALEHPSVFVKLCALRWFQDKPGMVKPHVKTIVALLESEDEWLRIESLGALERYHYPTSGNALSAARLLTDENVLVRRHAGKALAKMLPRVSDKSAAREVKELPEVKAENMLQVRLQLENAMNDADVLVRQKAEKALRKSGLLDG